MEIKAVDHSVNIVGVEKNGRKYAMCVAWATQVAEDKLICAIGPQSATGRAIAAGDIIGFSNLTKAQIPVAFQLGDVNRHSDSDNKLTGIDYKMDETAIIINGARAEIKCKVINIIHLSGIEAENIIYLQMLDGKQNEGDALHISDLKF